MQYCCLGDECPGMFHCRNRATCIDLEKVCDGVVDCGQGDDEKVCETNCPTGCMCSQLILNCSTLSKALSIQSKSTRSISVINTGIQDEDLVQLQTTNNSRYLLHMNLSHNLISKVMPHTFHQFSNLLHLDLSFNNISKIHVKAFYHLSKLEYLNIVGNTILDQKGLVNVLAEAKDYLSKTLVLAAELNLQTCCLVGRYVDPTCYDNLEMITCDQLIGQPGLRELLLIITGLNATLCLTAIIIEYKRRTEDYMRYVISINIFISGCFMTVYALIIGVFAFYYNEGYAEADLTWRNGGTCKTLCIFFTWSFTIFITIHVLISFHQFRLPNVKDEYVADFIQYKLIVLNSFIVFCLLLFINIIPIIQGEGYDTISSGSSALCAPITTILQNKSQGFSLYYVLITYGGIPAASVLLFFILLSLTHISCKSHTKSRDDENKEITHTIDSITQYDPVLRTILLILSVIFLCICITGR